MLLGSAAPAKDPDFLWNDHDAVRVLRGFGARLGRESSKLIPSLLRQTDGTLERAVKRYKLFKAAPENAGVTAGDEAGYADDSAEEDEEETGEWLKSLSGFQEGDEDRFGHELGP